MNIPKQRTAIAMPDFLPMSRAEMDRLGWNELDVLLVTGDNKSELAAPDGKWTRVWEGNRPGDRKEKFRLYRR